MRYPKTMAACIAVMSFLLFSGGDVPGEMFKWVDKNGTSHIQDDPPESGGKPMNLLSPEATVTDAVLSGTTGPA